MATLRNDRKLAAISRDSHEDHPNNIQAQNTNSPRIQEEYITQVSVEFEGRVTKNLSQEFSRTKSRILIALSKLDEFLLNPQARVHSEPVPETSRNSNRENQGAKEDRFQNDPHPEMGESLSQSLQEFSTEKTSYRERTFSGVFLKFFARKCTKNNCSVSRNIFFIQFLFL